MPGKILVVDDEVHIRMLLEQTLEELEDDYDVELLTAENGEEGLDLLTAKGQEVDRKHGLELGAERYMTKPFDPDEILEVAKSILQLEG